MSTRNPKTPKALPADFEPLLTIRQLAALLNVCYRTVERMIAEGKIEFYRIGAAGCKGIRFSKSQFEAYLAKHTVTPSLSRRKTNGLEASI